MCNYFKMERNIWNFHGQDVDIAIAPTLMPFSMRTVNAKGKTEFGGTDFIILSWIAKKLNFNMK